MLEVGQGGVHPSDSITPPGQVTQVPLPSSKPHTRHQIPAPRAETCISSLTDVVIGFSNVVIPDGNVQGFLGQVTVFDVIEELLQKWEHSQHTPKDGTP